MPANSPNGPDQNGDHLEITAPDGSTRNVALSTQSFTVGRDGDNDLTLFDDKISRRHVRLQFDGSQWQVMDLKSANGTRIDQTKLLPSVPETFRPGSVLHIGRHRLRLVAGTGAAPAPAAQDHGPPGTQIYNDVANAAGMMPGQLGMQARQAAAAGRQVQQLGRIAKVPQVRGVRDFRRILLFGGVVVAALASLGALGFGAMRFLPDFLPSFQLGAKTSPVPPPLMAAGLGALADQFGIEFVLVPAGAFALGNNESEINVAWDLCKQSDPNCRRDEFTDESPAQRLELDSFWIGKTEVTNAQFRSFIDAGGYTNPDLWTEEGKAWRDSSGSSQPGCWEDARFNHPQQPVVCISWHEALAYATWLSRISGLPVRLPTEAEWEKAARGEDGRTYPWGPEPPDGTRANYCDAQCEKGAGKDAETDDAYPFTAPVAFYPRGFSPYAALDMAGNVAEWTSTAFGCTRRQPFTYPYRADDGRERLDRNDCRIFRGGSWDTNSAFIRATSRGSEQPDTRLSALGMRLAVSARAEAPVVATLQAQSAATTVAVAVATAATSADFRVNLAKVTEQFKIQFVHVEGGEFLMGGKDADIDALLEWCKQTNPKNPDAACRREDFAAMLPAQVPIHVDDFWIGRTEVTNAQYTTFVDAGGYADRNLWTEAGWQWREGLGLTRPPCLDLEPSKLPEQPISCLSWYEATAYANWLSRQTNLPIRLPSDAQWEKAARGTDGRTYPWGEDTPDATRANYCDRLCLEAAQLPAEGAADDGHLVAAPVGFYPAGAGPYGSLDMAGNAWEWTSTAWGGCQPQGRFVSPYRGDDGREDPAGDDCRILRGGSFALPREFLRTGLRFAGQPDDNQLPATGIRLVVVPAYALLTPR